jgi:hypothetical protein
LLLPGHAQCIIHNNLKKITYLRISLTTLKTIRPETLKLLTEDIENSLLVIGIPKYQGETL